MNFSKKRPVKIVMLGAGGTGAHIAPHLYRLLYALERPVKFIICDGDKVEPKNLVRQNFTEADLGENKARVIAERYSDVFGLETSYIPRFIEDAGQLEELLRPEVFRHYVYGSEPNTGRWVTNSELVILIGAVDNNKSRKLCHEVFLRARDLVYIDSGNGEYTGQIVCGIRRAGKTVYKPVGMLYPEVSTPEDLFPTEVSCAEASVSAPQTIVANLMAATAVVTMIYNILVIGCNTVGDKPLEEIHSWERGKLVGNVFQDPRSQFFANEVAGEIAFGCENYGYTHEEIQSHVLQAAQYNKIEDLLDHSLHTLSYGMRQKVAIASAQAIEPEIYVMDEPSANLDIESTYRFGDIIRNLKAQGKTIVIAEHRLYYLMDVADRFFCIQHGAIVREFSREEMKSLPSAEVHTLGLRTPDLYQMAFQQMPSAATDEVVLETQGLHKAFDGTVVAEHLDFVCHRGEIVGIIGPNGTGKSTFGRILAGLLKENSGEVFLFGHKTRPRERMGKVWYIPQDLDSQLFGEDLVDELTTGAPTDEKRNARARTILKALELEEYAEQHPATLSGGQKQRLALGVALMHDAPIIILDEPTSGLDGANMRNVSQIIRKLAGMGRTILVITHDAECALSCCDRAIRLENGAITDDFPIHSVDILLDKIGYQSCGQRGVCYSGT